MERREDREEGLEEGEHAQQADPQEVWEEGMTDNTYAASADKGCEDGNKQFIRSIMSLISVSL